MERLPSGIVHDVKPLSMWHVLSFGAYQFKPVIRRSLLEGREALPPEDRGRVYRLCAGCVY